MKMQELNKQDQLRTNGGSAERSVGVNGTIGADSLLSFTSESTNGDDYHRSSFTAGNGFSLSLLGLKRNYNEY